jgi:YggT family protein
VSQNAVYATQVVDFAARMRDLSPLPRGRGRFKCHRAHGHQGEAMIELLQFISYLITLYTYVVIASVVMSWLIGFNVINAYNPTVRTIWNALNVMTEPLLRPIRRFIQRILPDLRGIDISPIFLLIGCYFVQAVVLPNIAKLFL